MGEKTVLMDVEETVLRYDAAVMLRKLADGLAQGKLVTPDGEVEVGGQVNVECKGKMKPKDDGQKGSIKIELSWLTPTA
ncbi:MAG: amphi-Trp domain-containing protein [Acidobacteriota bacterium]